MLYRLLRDKFAQRSWGYHTINTVANMSFPTLARRKYVLWTSLYTHFKHEHMIFFLKAKHIFLCYFGSWWQHICLLIIMIQIKLLCYLFHLRDLRSSCQCILSWSYCYPSLLKVNCEGCNKVGWRTKGYFDWVDVASVLSCKNHFIR